MSYMPYRLWLSMITQQGVRTIENNKFVYGESTRRPWRLHGQVVCRRLRHQGAGLRLFHHRIHDGKSAFMLNGVWEVPSVNDGMKGGRLGFEVGCLAALLLQRCRRPGPTPHALAIPNNKGKPISAEKMKGVARFATYINQHAITWAEGGHIPAYEPVVETKEFKEMPLLADWRQQHRQPHRLRPGRLVAAEPQAPAGHSLQHFPCGPDRSAAHRKGTADVRARRRQVHEPPGPLTTRAEGHPALRFSHSRFDRRHGS